MKTIISKILKSLLSLLIVFSTISTSAITLTNNVKAATSEVEKEDSYTQYVDPFVCTDVDYGQLFPGSVVPNGLVKLSPDTYPHDTLDHAGYDYSKLQIQGFSHTRIEGVGGQGAGGDVLVTPTYVQYTKRPDAASRAMAYVKEDESAKPGYYSVSLTPNKGTDSSIEKVTSGKIKAELTSDVRTGYHRYTFPNEGKANILVDLNYTYHGTDIRNAILDVLEESATTTALGGRFSGKNVSGNGKYTMYFYMETSKAATSVKTWNGETLSSAKSQKGNDLGAVLTFDVEDNEEIEVKVSISPISVEQAKIDMYNEVSGWDCFDEVYKKADASWNNVLGKVRIENSVDSDPTGELKQLFYTHLYHMFMTPVNATSTSGTYRGTDGKIYEANDYVHYDSWTLWDDYRKYAMIGLIMPETYKDMIQSIADALNTGIVTWSHDKQPVPNVRTEHAIALLADGIAKGYTDIDGLLTAYEAAKKIANNVITSSVEALGYVANRVDRTIEYAYDDYCLSLVAEALGLKEESEYYLNRSFNYKNTFRKDAIDSPFSENKLGLLWNKSKDGTWSTASPTQIGANSLYQGSMWQYTWYGSHDISGLMELMGGKQGMLEGLMYMFGMQDTSNGNLYLHNAANEVELNLPYFFNYVGRADLTQYWIRKIYTGESYNTGYASGLVEQKMYKLSPQGYLETMDDDAGTMAMMFVSSAMGIFPMTPGDSSFQIGTPFFDKLTLEVGNGKTFTIEANNVSEDNYYIQSATYNGKEFGRTWLDYSEITTGGVLRFEMGDEPSDWGSTSVNAPSASDKAPTSYYDEDAIQYSSATFMESSKNDGSIEDVITVTVNTTTLKAEAGEDLVEKGLVKVENVPAGLSAHAIVKDDTTFILSFSGKALAHKTNNSVDNVKVTIKEGSFTSSVESIRTSKEVRITFVNDTLSYAQTKLNESTKDDGSIEGSVEITLTGDVTFSGNTNEDYVKNGKVVLQNVPEGLSASLIKKDAKTAVLAFTGKAVKHDYDVNISIAFNDRAFSNNASSEIVNSTLHGMNAFILDFFKDYKDALKAKLEEAKAIDEDAYQPKSYAALVKEIEEATALLESEASEEQLKEAITDLTYAMENLEVLKLRDALDKMEGEKADGMSDGVNKWNNGPLKQEAINLGNTYEGAWVVYNSVDFDMSKVVSLDVCYDAPTGRSPSDAILYAYLDDIDGTLIATIPLTQTGSSWGTYVTKNVEIANPELLNGVHDVYFVMDGTTNSSQPYIANIDYMQFKEKEKEVVEILDTYKIEFEKDQSKGGSNWSGGDLKTESSTDSAGNGLVNIGGTKPNAWLKYNDVNFDTFASDEIVVRYVNNSSRCKPDAKLHFYLDSMDNEPFVSVAIPASANNWKEYVEVSAKINKELSGTHTVYVKMTGSEGSNPYIANLDYFKFNKVEVAETYKVEFEKDQTKGGSNWSGGDLKTENSKDSVGASLVNVGGTKPNAWLKYNDVNFDTFASDEIVVRYVNNSSRCKPDATLHFYLDSMDSEPFVSVAIPSSGSNWNAYTTVREQITKQISGTHTVYVKMTGTQGSNPYIANLDYFQFEKADVLDEYIIEFEKDQTKGGTNWSGGDLKTESSKDSNGTSLVNVGGTKPNAWLKYNDVNFNLFESDKVVVRYVNNSSRCKPDATLHFYLDSMDNEPFVSVAIPSSGSNWNAYTTVSAAISKEISGTHTVYVKMTGTQGSNPYIANLDWFKFEVDSTPVVVDTSKLEEAYDEALVLLENEELYEVAGIVRLENFVEKTKEALKDTEITQEEVDTLTEKLEKAMSLLTYKIIDDLKELIEKCENITEDYTKESFEALETPLANAKAVEEGSSYETYKEAYDSLKEAYDAMELLDRTSLKDLLDTLTSVDYSLFKEDGKDALFTAMEEANVLLDTPKVSQLELDEMETTLKEKFGVLELIPDPSELETLIKDCEALNKDDYTEKSWNALLEEIKNAKEVLAKEDVTQEEIDDAYVALLEMKDALVKESVGTGDSTNILLWIILLLGSSVVLLRKRKQA